MLGVGTIAYRVFAPEVIKSSRNITDYAVNSSNNVSARILVSMYQAVISIKPEVASNFLQRAPWLDGSQSLKTASDALRNDDGQLRIDLLRSFYDLQNRHTARSVVYIVLVFFVLGFLMLAIPGLEFTKRVLCVVGHDLGVL